VLTTERLALRGIITTPCPVPHTGDFSPRNQPKLPHPKIIPQHLPFVSVGASPAASSSSAPPGFLAGPSALHRRTPVGSAITPPPGHSFGTVARRGPVTCGRP
jgi:hypothetical protein